MHSHTHTQRTQTHTITTPTVTVDLPHLMTHSDWSINPSIMLANALTAFILNLVSLFLSLE